MSVSIIDLPQEILIEIGQYLNVQDLLVCSAVCKDWRDTFNQDCLWRRRCDRSLEETLRTQTSLVEPSFVLPETTNSLNPLGIWRQAFMRECHFFNNWQHGRFQKKRMHVERNEEGYGRVFYVGFLTFDRIIMMVEERIDLWDVSTDPYEVVAKQFYCQPEPGIKPRHVSISKNFVTITCDNTGVVQVFRVDLVLNLITQTHAFILDNNVKISENKDSTIRQIINNSPKKGRVMCHSLGDYFLGVVGYGCPVLHVWDLNSGEKRKEEQFPNNAPNELASFIFHRTCPDLFFEMKSCIGIDQMLYVYVAYNPILGAFLPFFKSVNLSTYDFSRHAVLANYLVIGDVQFVKSNWILNFNVYNYKTDQLIYTTDGLSVSVSSDSFIFSTNYNLIFFNPFKKASKSVAFSQDYLQVLGQRLLHCLTNSICLVGKCLLETKTRFLCNEYLRCNDTCTLLISQREWEDFDQMCLYRFW